MPTATLQQSCDTARARALTATSPMNGVDPAAQMCCKPAYTRELPEGRRPHKCALSSTCRLMNKGCPLLSSLPACTNIADRAALSCCCASANAVASASAKRAAVACLAGCRFFIMSAISSPAVALLAPATAVYHPRPVPCRVARLAVTPYQCQCGRNHLPHARASSLQARQWQVSMQAGALRRILFCFLTVLAVRVQMCTATCLSHVRKSVHVSKICAEVGLLFEC